MSAPTVETRVPGGEKHHLADQYKRDAVRSYTASRHAVTDQIARRFFAGSATEETARKNANRLLAKLRRRRWVNVAGTVLQRPTGRPALVYGPPYRLDLLEHQVWVTEAELLMGIEFDREVPVGQTTVDGLFRKDGDLFAVEVDNRHRQSRRQYAEKVERLAQFEGYILVLCHTAERMASLVEWCHAARKRCLFNLFSKLANRQRWTDWTGEEVEI